MKLFGYYLSSAAYRVRIALNLKGVDYEQVSLTLRAGDHRKDDYLALNPQGLVPALALSGAASETILFQSMAILEYLEEVFPEPPLLPEHPVLRARVRAVANNIACDIHPLNNLRILLFLKDELGQDDETVNTTWYHQWLKAGFDGIERSIDADPFCFGEAAGLADVCLVPQVYNARRFKFDLEPYGKIRAVEEACLALAPFEHAVPENQPDAA